MSESAPKRTKSLLIISYHFPPDAAIGAVRPAELAKLLPDFGWIPYVLSVGEQYYEMLDYSRYQDLSSEVYRTKKAGSINDLYLYLKSIFGATKSSSPSIQGRTWFAPPTSKESVRSRLLRYYNSLLIYLPDKEIGWLLFAVFQGLRLIKRKDIDAFLTTSPPHSVHLIGLILKVFTNKLWIVDFRDPWELEIKPQRSRSALSDLIETRMEKVIVRNSDWVVSVTDRMTERLRRLHPRSQYKCITVPNGYDSVALAKYVDEKKYPIFTLTYVGSFYFGRSPFVLLMALANLLKKNSIEKDAIQVRLIGDCKMSDGQSVEEMVTKLGLDDVVSFIGSVPHDMALREIARSHTLLLMAPCQPLQIPGKVYEYIGLRTSILAICQDGATKNLLESYPKARVVSPESVSETEEAVMFFYEATNMPPAQDSFPYERYERTAIAKEISRLLSKT